MEGEVTHWLRRWSASRSEALEALLPLVVDELRRLARSALRREPRPHTLQPTALVNELYLKLVRQRTIRVRDRSQFFGLAAHLMRRILVDHHRARWAAKRRGGAFMTTVDEALDEAVGRDLDLLRLDDALRDLTALDPRQGRVVELRFFAGLSVKEAAEVLSISPATVKREWSTAKAWLARQLRHA